MDQRPEQRPVPSEPPGGPRPPAADDGHAHPADPTHDLSDSPAHAQSPDAYTETPGSHRRTPDGPALDVGG